MAGSGKSEVINYLQEQHGWPKIYLGKFVFERLEKEGLAINYKNEKLIREKNRAELGMGAHAKLAMPEIKKVLKTTDIFLIESLYSWAEYKIFKKAWPENFKVIAVYASPTTRFARLQKRKIRPIKSLSEFNARDWTEIEGTDKGGPIAIADYTIVNNEINLNKFHQQIDLAIKTLLG